MLEVADSGRTVLRCHIIVLCAAQEDPDKDYGKKDRRREEERRRKAARSGFVRDLVQELEGAPEEVRPLTSAC